MFMVCTAAERFHRAFMHSGEMPVMTVYYGVRPGPCQSAAECRAVRLGGDVRDFRRGGGPDYRKLDVAARCVRSQGRLTCQGR